MNMTDTATPVEWLSTNAWWLVLTTVAILVGTYLSLFDRLGQYINRPKLAFESKLDEKSYPKSELLDPDQLWDKINFWIMITNKGKIDAVNSRVFLKLTDSSGTIQFQRKLSYPSYNESFQVNWSDNGQEKEIISILASKDYGYLVKIPVRVEFPIRQIEKNPLFQRGMWIAESPIENWNWKAVIAEKEYDYLMKIEIKISYDNYKPQTQQFIIRTKLGDYIDRNAIEFFMLKKKSRFSFLGIH